MSETLKEAKPSDEAWSKAKETYTRTGSWSESVRVVCAIDVAPLIAERDEWEAQAGILRDKLQEAEEALGRFSLASGAERDALKARVVEVEKGRDTLNDFIGKYNDAIPLLESALAASRRQVEGLKEALRPFSGAWESATSSFGKKSVTFGILGAVASYFVTGVHFKNAARALSALDAPQSDALAELAAKQEPLGAEFEKVLYENLFELAEGETTPDPRDAIIAEALEVMRTLSPIKDVPIFRDEEPVVLRVGNFGEYVYIPFGTWSIFRAARSFVEKHGAKEPK